VLGHTSEAEAGLSDSELTPRSLREVEAEAVALVCLEALGLPGAEHCRGYVQHWNAHRGAEPIPERSAQRIFKAADQILRAGTLDAEAASDFSADTLDGRRSTKAVNETNPEAARRWRGSGRGSRLPHDVARDRHASIADVGVRIMASFVTIARMRARRTPGKPSSATVGICRISVAY
jgi:hypothetical protein